VIKIITSGEVSLFLISNLLSNCFPSFTWNEAQQGETYKSEILLLDVSLQFPGALLALLLSTHLKRSPARKSIFST
jgi:hypothetical protein